MASISVSESYDSSNKQLTLTCSISGMAADYSGSRRLVYNVGNGDKTLTVTSSGTSDTKTINVSLAPGKTCYYSFDLQWKNSGGTEWASATSESGSYTAPAPSVDKWSWYSSNGNATSTQTSSAYSAVLYNGKLSDFSYQVWNDLCMKVKEVLDATGDSWNSTYLSYNSTLMSWSSKLLTADRWNSLRYNVGIHHSTGIYEVSSGAVVYGSYFTRLVNAINDWIDEI